MGSGHLASAAFGDATGVATSTRATTAPMTAGLGRRLLDICTRVAKSPDFAHAIEEIVTGCVGVEGASRCTFLLLDQAHDELEIAADCSEPAAVPIVTGVRVRLDRWPAVRAVLASRQARVLHSSEPGLSAGEWRLIVKMAESSVLVVPLTAEAEAIGGLFLFGRSPDTFANIDPEAGALLSNHLGLALANARALERSRRATTTRAALFRITQAAISGVDQGLLLGEVIQAAVDVVGCDACTVEIWHPDTDEVETVALRVSGDQACGLPLYARVDLAGLFSLRSALHHQSTVQTHPMQLGVTETELDVMRRLGAQTLLIVPMVVRGDALGALMFASRRQRAFDAEAMELA